MDSPSPKSTPLLQDLLSFLVQSISAEKVLEIGTFHGDSTLALAKSMKYGQIFTIEKDMKRAQFAESRFSNFEYAPKIHQILADAETFLPNFSETNFDLIFIDANKSRYPFYLDWATSNLLEGGLLVADNTLIHKISPKYRDGKSNLFRAMEEFNLKILNSAEYFVLNLPNCEDRITVGLRINPLLKTPIN